MAGGFVVPLMRAAGWSPVLVGRDAAVVEAIECRRGLWVRIGVHREAWVDGVSAMVGEPAALTEAVAATDLVVTAVGPSELTDAGRSLAGPVLARMAGGRPLNLLTFENHRRAPELLASAMLDVEPTLAPHLGRRLGFGGAAVWRAIARREVRSDGVHYLADEVDDCFVDRQALVGAPPLTDPLAGVKLVSRFDDYMVEKLWLFNGGHAAAAYLGWLSGCGTVADAMALPAIRTVVRAVVEDARTGLRLRRRQRGLDGVGIERSTDWILGRYGDESLADGVTRVGREPRRKLAPGDRLLGPAVTSFAAGRPPEGLIAAIAAALAYDDPDDQGAADLHREVALLGPEEALDLVCGLQRAEPLARAISERYRELAGGLAGSIEHLADRLSATSGRCAVRNSR
jgi:mannitol-1-phosphate 5-dehydrogenase